jgi:membrane dipeptidase
MTPPRLIDLHTDWLLQYAPESTVFGAENYPHVSKRLEQAEGYLGSTSAAILSCYRNSEDWRSRDDPWSALGELITRIEAEFSGRILRDPIDFEQWELEPESLTWAVIGVEGFDWLVRTDADLKHLDQLFDRGVRLFQPTYNAHGLLAGSSAPGDDRGLTDLGRAFLEALVDLCGDGARPALDLAHLNPRAMSEVLDWLEADGSRTARLVPVYSHGGLVHDGFKTPRALTLDSARRLRTLGGFIGLGVTPPFVQDADQIAASIDTLATIPWNGQTNGEAIAIGTDFLGVDATLPALGSAPEVIAWVMSRFRADMARRLLYDNGRRFLAILSGVSTAP